MQDSYPKQFGNYILTRRIAVGGMAEVFKAKLIGAMGFQKTIALKRILPEYGQDEEFVQMFVDEARISSNLHHKNIVQVFDFGEVDGQYYLTMEFIDGSNLKNLFFRTLKQNRFLPREMIYFIILKTASALEYAHKVKIEGQLESMQLVHRDVSPQNILISKLGDVKITDFGIAKATIKISQTQPGKIQGKYSYMSPEQALGKNLNYQSDIFSLGIVFYELLTAKKVYGSSETVKRYSEATKANIPRIGTLLPDLPSQIDTLITRMVARNPQERPKDCTEIIDTLTEFLSASSDEVFSAQLGDLVKELFPESIVSSGKENSLSSSSIAHIQLSDKPHSIADAAKGLSNKEKTTFFKKAKRISLISLIALLMLFGLKFFPKMQSRQKPLPTIEQPTTENEEASPETSGGNDELKNLEMQLSQIDDEIEIAQAELQKAEAPPPPPEPKVETPTEIPEVDELPVETTTAPVPPPPEGCPSNMVTIESGSFMMGSNDSERNDLVEQPAKKQSVEKYCIDRYEYPNQKGATPTRSVSLSEAKQLCENNGKRLCSEVEWERACKGSWSLMNNQQYSFGSQWVKGICNTKDYNSMMEDRTNDLANSGDFAECTTPDGVHDLNGNVQEWTSSKGHFQNDEGKYIIKGGSYQTPKFQSRCSFFREDSPILRQADVGFRCCKTP